MLYTVITSAFNINRLGILGLMLDDVSNHVFFRCFSMKKKSMNKKKWWFQICLFTHCVFPKASVNHVWETSFLAFGFWYATFRNNRTWQYWGRICIEKNTAWNCFEKENCTRSIFAENQRKTVITYGRVNKFKTLMKSCCTAILVRVTAANVMGQGINNSGLDWRP